MDKSELDKKIQEKIDKFECIHEPDLLKRLSEILEENYLMKVEIEDKEDQIKTLNKNGVARSHCKHFKGQHENEYFDCTVICDLHDDDYVSRCECECCKDFELEENK